MFIFTSHEHLTRVYVFKNWCVAKTCSFRGNSSRGLLDYDAV